MKQYKESLRKGKKKDFSSIPFQEMAKRINRYLKEEDISLNFKGYNETLARYFRLQDNDLYEIYELMIECNLWSNYLADVESLIQLKASEALLEKDRLQSFWNKKAPDKHLELQLKRIKEKAKDFTLFHKQLIAQKTFFEQGFWHCYKLYEKGNHQITYKVID